MEGVFAIFSQLWYTSGIVNTLTDMKWEGDGTRIDIAPRDQYLWWASEADRHINYSRIIYRTDSMYRRTVLVLSKLKK